MKPTIEPIITASGTTMKQVNNERDALAVGYGGMLIEGVLARAVQHEVDHMNGRLFLSHLGELLVVLLRNQATD